MTKRKTPQPAAPSPPAPPTPSTVRPAASSRFELWRVVIAPTIELLVSFVLRVLLLAAVVWLLSKSFGD